MHFARLSFSYTHESWKTRLETPTMITTDKRQIYTRLMASLPEHPGTRKVKPIWILMKQETMGWQWHQLDHMQIICTSLQTDNHITHLS